MSRHFFRCYECLSVSAIDADNLAYNFRAICGACGDPRHIEYMGKVQRSSLVKDELRTPCDDRCTNARGPLCECKCGGPNHGTKLLVAVQIDCGPIPVITPHAPVTARLRAKEFRDAYNHALENLPGSAENQRHERKEFLRDRDFAMVQKFRDALGRLHDIEQMRSHPARMKALRELTRSSPKPAQTQTGLFTGGAHV